MGDLLEKIQATMPADRPGKLSPAENAAILAYILKYNKFPAGATDLLEKADDLRGVKFEAEKK